MISASKLRVLLAALLVGANNTSSVDQLAERLWGEVPPAGARRAVQVYVVRLRKLLGEGVIATMPEGYRLLAGPDQLDVLRFNILKDAAAHTGDAEAELRYLTEALACWRGPALADVPSESLQREVVAQLAESRLRVTERRMQVALDLGRHREIITDLVQLTKDHPWHEAFWVQLVLALDRSDRLADALDTCRTVHRRFRDELGIDPGEQLQQLHEVLLAGQSGPPHAAAPAPVPISQLPARVRGFIGRDAQAERLAELLRTDAVVVSGPPGVGKTALALHVAHQLRLLYPDGQLYVDLQGHATDPPLSPDAVLTRFLRALGVPREQVPGEPDAKAALYRSALGGRTMLVLLDNAAEPGQVRPLLPGEPGCGVLITSRNDLRGLSALDGVVHVPLEVLPPEHSRALLTALLGAERAAAEPDAVDDLAAACGHLPLALRIAGANLAANPHDTVAGYTAALTQDRVAQLTVDGDEHSAVRAAFDRSYVSLSAGDRRVFRLLGLTPGPDFTAAAAAELAEQEPRDTRRTLSRLTSANLLHQFTEDRYRFHDLIREYAADRAHTDSATDTAAALDRIFDYYLRTAAAATQLDWLDSDRHNLIAAMTRAAGSPAHYRYACRFVDVLRTYLDARADATEAISGCEAVLHAATRAGDHRAEGTLLDVLGKLHFAVGDYERAIEYQRRALVAAERSGDVDRQCHALLNLGRVHTRRGLMAEAEKFHLAALELSPSAADRSAECVALNAIGVVRMYSGRPASAVDWHHRSIKLATDTGDDESAYRAYNGLGMTRWALGELDNSIECHERVLAYARAAGQLQGETASVICLAEVHGEAGRYELALRLAAEGIAHAVRLGERRAQVNALDVTGTVRHRMGDHAAAIACHAEALHIADEICFGYGRVSASTGLATAHRCLGEPRAALDHLRRAETVLAESGLLLLEARVLTEAALVHYALRARQEALRCAEHAIDLAEARGQRLLLDRALAARHTITTR